MSCIFKRFQSRLRAPLARRWQQSGLAQGTESAKVFIDANLAGALAERTSELSIELKLSSASICALAFSFLAFA